MCEIIPNLWLGNIIDSKNRSFLENIDIVINASIDIPFTTSKTDNIRISVDDNLEKKEIIKLYTHLNDVTELIYSKLLQYKRIFVHCYAGKQRSATIICAYLIRYLSLSLEEATLYVRTKRSVIFTPCCNFEGALLLFEKQYITK